MGIACPEKSIGDGFMSPWVGVLELVFSSIPCGSPVFLYGSDLLSLLKSSVSHVMVAPAAQFEVFSLFDDAEFALLLVLKGMN
ncbi:hypothetical protein COP1_028922 [Malus domestica]